MASSTLEVLRELEKHERTVVDQYGDDKVNLNGLGYGDKLKVVQDLSRNVFAHGKYNSHAGSDAWGAGGARIPLPIFLTIQGGPIVDIAPIPEEELIKRTGVNAEQLKILGQENLVNLNLYADSELSKPDPAYAEFDHLKDILDHRVTGCRIHGIRRQKVFDLIGYDDQAQIELVRRLAEKFLPHLQKFDLDELNDRQGGALVEDHYGGAAKLANNVMYLEVLGGPKDKEFVDELDGEEWPYDIEVVLEHTRQRKLYLCTPITASFGGTTSYSVDGYNHSIYVSAVEPKPRVRTIDHYRKRMAEFSMLVGAHGVVAPVRSTPSSGQLFYTDRTDFMNFVAFLRDKRWVLDRADKVLREMLKLAPNEDEFERLLAELSDLTDDIEKDASGLDSLAGLFIGSIAGGAAGHQVCYHYKQYVEAVIPEKVTRRVALRSIGSGLGAGFGAVAGALTERAFNGLPLNESLDDIAFSRKAIGTYVADLRYR